MGLILDSSVLIKAERQGQNARHVLMAIPRIAGETEVALSVVTLIELAHGAARADTTDIEKKNGSSLFRTAHGDSHPSGHCANRISSGSDRWRESGQGSAPSIS